MMLKQYISSSTSSSALFLSLIVLLLGLSQGLPVPSEDQQNENVKTAATAESESKVYNDMLKLLEEVEASQTQLQALQKATAEAANRREDTGVVEPAVSGADNSQLQTTSKLLDMEKIVKALEGVASTLSKGSNKLLAAASSQDDAVLRNERDSGYGAPAVAYGPNSIAETPNNFINVFSQAAANTVNFATQLLNSLVGVAANILQGTVSTLLSLLNAKGQIVGAVVQSAPPVLASVTRTAGDVLAAKARIFGAVTQSAVNFASQLGSTVTNTFAGLFNGPNAINFNAAGRSADNPLGGFGNLANSIVNSQLNLLNGILTPFTRGVGGGDSSSSASSAGSRGLASLLSSLPLNPLSVLFRRPNAPSGSTTFSSSYDDENDGHSDGEPNFRITIGAAASPKEDDEGGDGEKKGDDDSSSSADKKSDDDSKTEDEASPPPVPSEPEEEKKRRRRR